MDKEKFLQSKIDEFILVSPKWAEHSAIAPFTALSEIKKFFESIYDAGASTIRTTISGKDLMRLFPDTNESKS
jgi:hypothetical protein